MWIQKTNFREIPVYSQSNTDLGHSQFQKYFLDFFEKLLTQEKFLQEFLEESLQKFQKKVKKYMHKNAFLRHTCRSCKNLLSIKIHKQMIKKSLNEFLEVYLWTPLWMYFYRKQVFVGSPAMISVTTAGMPLECILVHVFLRFLFFFFFEGFLQRLSFSTVEERIFGKNLAEP